MRTRIVAETLIPGRGEPVEGGTVITEFGQIAYAGATTEAPRPVEGEEFHEVAAVMPGLWDCHAHFVELFSLDGPRSLGRRAGVGDLTELRDDGATFDGFAPTRNEGFGDDSGSHPQSFACTGRRCQPGSDRR